jgi:ketosteroid isomerase-like protein
LHTELDGRAFAEKWISDWNRRDAEAVLARFSENVIFTSPRAKAIVGSSRVEGKSRLREYWTKAMARIQSIRFTLDYVIGDGDRIGIVYISEINGVNMRSVEFLTFGADGLVHEGEAMHGIEL